MDGKRIGKEIEAPQDVGVIIENPGFLPSYNWISEFELFWPASVIRSKKRIYWEVIERVGLDPKSKNVVGQIFHGNASKTGNCPGYHGKPFFIDFG